MQNAQKEGGHEGEDEEEEEEEEENKDDGKKSNGRNKGKHVVVKFGPPWGKQRRILHPLNKQ